MRERRRKADRRKEPRKEPDRRQEPEPTRIDPDDPDVIVTDRGTIRVLHRPDETHEEYEARLHAASPPLSEEQKDTILAAAKEYWAIIRERGRRREM